MASPASRRKRLRPVKALDSWKLEDAKARLSELVRRAGIEGPQLVTSRGREVAVILAPEQYQELLPKPAAHRPLLEFLQGLGLSEVHVERESDQGRDIVL